MAFITTEGTITRTFFNGKGAELTETFQKRDGTEGKKRYTLWFQSEHGLSEGDTGKFSGTFDASVDEWQDKEGQTRHTAKVSVNNARIETGRTSSQQSSTPADEPWSASAGVAAPAGESWAQSGAESLPF